MPEPEPAAVTTDDIFDVLHRLGCPTVFLSGEQERAPDTADMPQLIGALAAAVDRLTIAHGVPVTLAGMRGWAAGYLQITGATTPCGSRTAFDVLCVRLQMFEVLYEGLRTTGPTAELMRACLGAASRYAVSAATAHAVTAGVIDGGDPAIVELSRRQLDEATTLLGAAVNLDGQLHTLLGGAAGTDAAGAGVERSGA